MRRDLAAAYYALGVSYSTGTAGVPLDLVEAHKWFNIAAGSGGEASRRAAAARAEIAGVMRPDDIVTAQRCARAWREAEGVR
ncbi:hypothetical protein E2493_06200 [Sphingomonas parva]|uniref:Sel1 repeat family protein n=1 Tax=Sphingomonas parva TaxID=2555898 RepID=A0A4Y8ZT69_9SPHN|nr:SEL1-like repeat protein [Sphingomonas parva]TFI59114.1 hypothetical protein E2493_06200 [Sphingomonas parva]